MQRASVPQLSSALCDSAVCSASHARNAYSALLLFPHMSFLRFYEVMKHLRKRWNHAAPNYGAIFDAIPFLRRLLARPLNRSSVSQVRDRLLIVWRLFQLHRSVNLEHARRAVSEVNGKCYILAKQKGWTEYRWEQVLSFPSNHDAIPWHLLLLYAKLTELLLPKGTKEGRPVCWSLSRPYKPIGAKRLAALTKNVLQAHGVDTTVWQVHSTRGAGVDMFSSWSIAPEVVSHIGSWSSLVAFCKHYMRLNAVAHVQTVVHTHLDTAPVVSGGSTDLSLSRSREPDLGRSEGEGETIVNT